MIMKRFIHPERIFTLMALGALAIGTLSSASFAEDPKLSKFPKVDLYASEPDIFYFPGCPDERKMEVDALIKSKAVLRNGESVEDAMRFRKRLEDLWPKITAGLTVETVQWLSSLGITYYPDLHGGAVGLGPGWFLSPSPHSETDAELVQKVRKTLADRLIDQEKAQLKVIQEKYKKLDEAAHGAYSETKDRYQRIGEDLDAPVPSAKED